MATSKNPWVRASTRPTARSVTVGHQPAVGFTPAQTQWPGLPAGGPVEPGQPVPWQSSGLFGLPRAGEAVAGLAAAEPDYMAQFQSLLGQLSGPAPSMSFNSAPFDNAIRLANQQAQLGRQAIQGGTQDLLGQLSQLQQQYGTRAGENQAAIQGMQQGALSNAQGAVSPVLADLQAQGVNTQALQAGANNRIGVMQDQASAQNILSQRLAENARQVMDSTSRSAATSGAGALNALTGNLSQAISSIGGAQAQAAQQAQEQYLQDLSAYNRQKMGLAPQILETIGGQMAGPAREVRAQWEGDESNTGQKVLEAFSSIDEGESPQQIIDQLNGPVPDDWGDTSGAETVKEYYKNNGIDASTIEREVRKYGQKIPKTKSGRRMSGLDLLMGMR